MILSGCFNPSKSLILTRRINVEKGKNYGGKQRFSNYKKVLSQLSKFFDKGEQLNEMEQQGLIKAFEYTYELAWNTLKD
jgi:hypothetical protein